MGYIAEIMGVEPQSSAILEVTCFLLREIIAQWDKITEEERQFIAALAAYFASNAA